MFRVSVSEARIDLLARVSAWPKTHEFAAVLGAALVVQAVFTWALAGWQIDDAGITFAYARNVALGRGLVSQPGFEPVEGYSNPTWLFLCAALLKIGVFNVFLTPKLMALLFMVLMHYVAYRLVRDDSSGSRLGLRPRRSSSSPPMRVLPSGRTQGLNSLLALLVIGAARLLVGIARADTPSTGRCLALGLVVALLALTRPDGMIFVAALPITLAWTRGLRGLVKPTLVALVPVFLLVGTYLAFRLRVFGHWLPNTATMKGGPDFLELARGLILSAGGVQKLVELFAGVFAIKSFWVLIVVCAFFARARSLFTRPGFEALAVLAALSILEYLLLPRDWMPHQRFGTPFIVVFSLLVPAAFARQPELAASPARGFWLGAALIGALVLGNLVKFATFVRPIPF